MILGLVLLTPSVDPPAFDATVSLGNLLTIGGFLVFVTMYIVNSRNVAKLLSVRLQVIDASMEDFKNELKKLADVVVKQAEQAIKMSQFEQRSIQEGQRVDEIDKRVNKAFELINELRITMSALVESKMPKRR